jgi:hypothetical protein
VREFTAAEVDELLERSFEKLEHHLLDAPVPGSSELLPRFYVFVGRRRPRWWQLWRRASRLPRAVAEAPPIVGRRDGASDDHGSGGQNGSRG